MLILSQGRLSTEAVCTLISISGAVSPLPGREESNTARSKRSTFRASYPKRVFTQPRPI